MRHHPAEWRHGGMAAWRLPVGAWWHRARQCCAAVIGHSSPLGGGTHRGRWPLLAPCGPMKSRVQVQWFGPAQTCQPWAPLEHLSVRPEERGGEGCRTASGSGGRTAGCPALSLASRCLQCLFMLISGMEASPRLAEWIPLSRSEWGSGAAGDSRGKASRAGGVVGLGEEGISDGGAALAVGRSERQEARGQRREAGANAGHCCALASRGCAAASRAPEMCELNLEWTIEKCNGKRSSFLVLLRNDRS